MEQSDVLRHVVNVLDGLGVRYALVGSYGSMAYGEFRMTQDIDVLAELTASNIGPLCTAFPPPEWYVSEPAAMQAVQQRRQFHIIHLPTANKIDFILPNLSKWGQQQLDRVQAVSLLPDRPVHAAHPEDVILGKLLYYREGGSDKHLRDIAGILDISGELVDRQSVTRWADELRVRDIWDEVVARIDSGQRE